MTITDDYKMFEDKYYSELTKLKKENYELKEENKALKIKYLCPLHYKLMIDNIISEIYQAEKYGTYLHMSSIEDIIEYDEDEAKDLYEKEQEEDGKIQHKQKYKNVINKINEYTEWIDEDHKDNGGHNSMFIGTMEENAFNDFLRYE
jgi:hypothetical protein